MFDSFGRRIDYLRISITDRCNLRCTYCMPCGHFRPLVPQRILTLEEILDTVVAAADLGIRKIRLTGGEPLVRRGVVELVRSISAVPGIETVGITTNGILLARFARDLKEAGLKALNVSLDTLDPERFREVTQRGRVESVIAGIVAAREAGIERIKVNTVVGPETSEHDLAAIRAFCRRHGLIHQRIALYSLESDKHDNHECDRPLPCEECNRIRLLSTGLLKPCLHSNEEVQLDLANPAESLRRTVALKPERGTVCTNRSMIEIGG
ncbi:MAG: radical SAM protein [Spirochaetaceae bacterium]|nr:MAG: radical SAM protein [Spirochaetaceae bacterium]